jgi:hypothetical protein
MSERTPEAQAAWPPTTLDKRVSELESRVEGLEHLLADLVPGAKALILAPKAAQAAAEEQYRSSPSTNERSSDAASR